MSVGLFARVIQAMGALFGQRLKERNRRRRVKERVDTFVLSHISKGERTGLREALEQPTNVMDDLYCAATRAEYEAVLRRLGVLSSGPPTPEEIKLVSDLVQMRHDDASFVEKIGREERHRQLRDLQRIDGSTEESLKLLRELQKRKNDPVGAMGEIAHHELRGYGIDAVTIHPDTKRETVHFGDEARIEFSATGEAAEKLKQFTETVQAGKKVELDLAGGDVQVTMTPAGLRKLMRPGEMMRLEVTPLPYETEKVVRYTIGPFSKAINTHFSYERGAERFTLKLKTRQPDLVIELTLNGREQKGNMNLALQTENGSLPGWDDASALRLMSHLAESEHPLELTDEGTDLPLVALDLESLSHRDYVRNVADRAYFVLLFHEANHALQNAGVLSAPLPWFEGGLWKYRPWVTLLEQARDVLRNNQTTFDLTGTTTIESINESIPEFVIEKGVFQGQIMFEDTRFVNHSAVLVRHVTFQAPRIKLRKGKRKLKVKSLQEAFRRYGGPIGLELSSEQAVISFSAPKDSELRRNITR